MSNPIPKRKCQPEVTPVAPAPPKRASTRVLRANRIAPRHAGLIASGNQATTEQATTEQATTEQATTEQATTEQATTEASPVPEPLS